MEKQKKWHLFLILTVVALTIYNILPTLFYYGKPLKSPVEETQAQEIAASIEKRLVKLEEESKDWIASFCSLIGVKPEKIQSKESHFTITFAKSEEATRFRKLLPRAGSLIPFAPAQLTLAPQEESLKEVRVQKRITAASSKNHFSFAKKGSKLYHDFLLDGASQVTFALAGPSEQAFSLYTLNPSSLQAIAFQIHAAMQFPESQKSVANRFLASFTQGHFKDRPMAIKALIRAFDETRDSLKQHSGQAPNEAALIKAETYLKNHEALFSRGLDPFSFDDIKEGLQKSGRLEIGDRNPFFREIVLDLDTSQIQLSLHPDVNPALLQQPLINELAKVARLSGETVTFHEGVYTIALHNLPEASGFLLFNLEEFGKKQAEHIFDHIQSNWQPKHQDLQCLSIVNSHTFQNLSPDEKALSLVIHQPTETNPSLFLTANGLEQIQKAYSQAPDSDFATQFHSDVRSLITLLEESGYRPHQGQNQQIIFEKADFYQSLLAATREKFEVKGTRKYASLELSTLEHRLLTENRIDTEIHNDLIKWRDEYNAAQVNLHEGTNYTTPRPTKNIFLHNLLLSMKKIYRGDERKIIRWGLDLSGGKTVQVELRNANHQQVKNEADLKQGINELYNRVNKMGVSEVSIRTLGNTIVLDFPGSQSLCASELIKASSMYFHIVNEKFSSYDSPLATAAQAFLRDVWNEAVVTNQKDAESVHAIAYRHLHGQSISETARTLLDNGLLLAPPEHPSIDSSLDTTHSKVALLRPNSQWFGQTHPLLLVFNNYTLEGSQLGSVQSNYDPQKGNYLSFDVKRASTSKEGKKSNPRDDLQAWTSRFSKETVAGSSLDEYTRGRGWRMAVILNGSVISAPTLDAVIRDSASISGHFSQREVEVLVSDLKAGSLSFTPHILSEKNVSPELGHKDRTQGIVATAIALVLVIASMVAYYRFSGLIASIALLFNLLFLWATLQNIGATLSLAGIAGVILTVGMAVDANVLVFERFKEEFNTSKNVTLAIQASYKKAYSAIVDSNVTTIIAALILLNFDAGPIKGFALTLIIGIASSMFSALFMTRYYFVGWARRNQGKSLTMANWIRAKSIDFLKYGRLAMLTACVIILSGSVLVYIKRSSIFGMDFTGGFSLHLELQKNPEGNYLQNVENALLLAGAHPQDFQVRELTPSNHLRILFGTGMELAEKPFFQMPRENDHQTNPRADWVVAALSSQEMFLTTHSLENMEANWTSMSGQISDSMRNNALLGLLLACLCIFIYLAFRFEYKFATASILCVIHDVLITVAAIGILHAVGVPVQIDLNTVAAIMTIVGYSLNDTIIIFDRIREEMKFSENRSLSSMINHALNATLSRTTITSGTTLLVLVALVVFGGASIFSFALVMSIGVFLGTLSSWYIASPLMLFFHHQETPHPHFSHKPEKR